LKRNENINKGGEITIETENIEKEMDNMVNFETDQ
jgi:hypothetical protein